MVVEIALADIEDLDSGIEVAELEDGGVVEGEVLRSGLLPCGIEPAGPVVVHVEDLHAAASGPWRAVVLEKGGLVCEANRDRVGLFSIG